MKIRRSTIMSFGSVAAVLILALTPCVAQQPSTKPGVKASAKPVVKHKKPPTAVTAPPPTVFPAYAQPLVRPPSPYQRRTGCAR